MYKIIFSFIFVPVFMLALAVPAQAATTVQYYQTNSQQQQIAYLSNLIAQLQAQLAALQINNNVNHQPYTSYSNYSSYQSGNSSSNEISRVVTGGVDSDGRNDVSMDGEVTFRRDSQVRVWFEYGTNSNLSYSTESIEINGDDGDTEDFEITATDLDDNRVYYYRAVAEDDNGRYVEGAVKSFRFESRNNYYNNDRNDNYRNNDWSLEIDDDYYETGDTVRVDYEVEDEDDKTYKIWPTGQIIYICHLKKW
jgi:hypothetical protein